MGRIPFNDPTPFSRAQLWIDIRDPWPFEHNQVQAIYIRHCLEHFTEKEVLDILAKCHRVLAPSAVQDSESAFHH